MTQPKKSKEETLAQMDADAALAKEAYDEMCEHLDTNTITALASWWYGWFQKAGHKRLAYILMGKEL